MKVYLCGAINGCSDAQCIDWRVAAEERLKELGIEVLDPMRRDFRGQEDDNIDAIVEGDYEDVRNSDILLVNAPSPSWGTAMEIHEAFRCDIPSVVIHPRGRISPWLRYHTAAIVHSLDDAINWIRDHV